MAFISALTKLNTIQSFEEAFKAKDITSDVMRAAISEWFNLYYDSEVLNEGADTSQRIPYVAVNEIYNAVFGEYKASSQDERMEITLNNLDKAREDIFQEALVGGEGFIKPIPIGADFSFSFINRNSYIVLEKNAEGDITSIGTAQQTNKGMYYYTLLERRTVTDEGLLIETRLYRSHDKDTLGNIAQLEELDNRLQPEITLPINDLGLVHIKMPMKNCVDGSGDCVSIYAAAVKEIRKLYKHDARTEDEYELTAPHLVASIDVQQRDSSGDFVEIPRYITALDEEPKDLGMTIYNPTPNQTQLEARENQILRSIENLMNLRRGILSHVETDDRTATEVSTSSARYALLIKRLQEVWQDVLRETQRICGQLGEMYFGWSAQKPEEIAVSWGNGVLYDEDKEYNRLYQLVLGGYLKPEYLLNWMKLHKMDIAEIAEIRQKFMPVTEGFGERLFQIGEDGV